LSYEVDKNLDKEKIAEIAIEHYDLVKEYIDAVEKREANTFGELMKKHCAICGMSYKKTLSLIISLYLEML